MDLSRVPDIFKDPEHQAQFNERGYVKVPFLNEEQLAYLNNLFDELHPNLPDSGFFSGTYSSDFAYKKKVSDAVKEVFASSFEKYFKDYTPLGGSFLYKLPSENSQLQVHQDWTIVDEEEAIALNCWVPLCDADEENGTLMILPGMHNGKFPVHRAPTLPFFFNGNEDVIMDNLVPLETKAGEAVILNQSLIHYSPPNRSPKIRKAITAGVVSKDAPLHFYYFDKNKHQGEIDKYKMDRDFLIKFDNFFQDIFTAPKHGTKVATVPYVAPKLEREELIALLEEVAPKKPALSESKPSFFNRLQSKIASWVST